MVLFVTCVCSLKANLIGGSHPHSPNSVNPRSAFEDTFQINKVLGFYNLFPTNL